jgi:hypothetical protein
MEKVKFRPSSEWLAAQKALMSAIGFNEDDLEANRGGYMSKKQRAMMSHERAAWLNRIAIMIVVIAGFFVFMIVSSRLQPGLKEMVLGGLILGGGIAALYMAYMRSRLNNDLHKGGVFVVDGTVSLYIAKTRDVITPYNYYLSVENRHFTVERSVYDVFTDGDPYAIYYAPHSKTLLSAEWLGKREMAD